MVVLVKEVKTAEQAVGAMASEEETAEAGTQRLLAVAQADKGWAAVAIP